MAVPIILSEVPDSTPYAQYIATSGQTVFPYPFPITQDSDLIVVVNGVTLNTDSGYTLTGQGDDTGGTVVFTLGQTAGTLVTVYRDIPIERITQIAQNSGFASTTFNAEFNNIYLIMQQLEASIGQCLQIPNTNTPSGAGTTLTPSLYASKYLSFDSNGNPTPAVLTVNGTVTQALVAGFIFPETSYESSAASLSIVQAWYAPGCVDRYRVNATPGTTSMTAAFQASINQARLGGADVTWGANAPYMLDGVIDCTFPNAAVQYGITFRQIGTPAVNLPTSLSAGLYINHNEYTCFDMTGCAFFNFYDLSAVTNTGGTYPETMFLTARNNTGESNYPRFFNTRVTGYFSTGILYNYGSEDGLYIGNIWENYATDGGAVVVAITSANTFKGTTTYMASNFTTIATGSQSTIGHRFIGGDYALYNASTTSDVFYLEGFVEHWSYTDGWWNCANENGTTHGRSLVCLDYDTVNSAYPYYGKISGLHGEVGATLPQYGVYVVGAANTVGPFTIDTCYFATNTWMVYSPGASTLLSGFNVRGISESATKGMSIAGTLEDSTVDYEGVISLNNTLRNFIITNYSNLTINGSDTNTTIIDRATGNIITTGTLSGTYATLTNGVKVNGTQVVGAQQTTSVAAATFVQVDTTTAVSTDSTFDGYTLKQVVKALRLHGLLA